MHLKNVPSKKFVEIVKINIEQSDVYGLIEGQVIQVLQNSPFQPLRLKVRDQVIGLRKSIAKKIEVKIKDKS